MEPLTARAEREDVLRSAASVLTKTGQAFLPAVVEEVARAFNARVAVVAELVNGDHLHTVAFWRDGVLAEDIDFPIAGTPCQALLHGKRVSLGDKARVSFPSDPLLAFPTALSYIVVPLVGTRDDVVGAMMVASDRDQLDEPHEGSLLELLAGRVAGELERMHAERDLQRSQEHLQAIQRVEAIGTLAGHIAHDFNNLLTIVIGYGEVLQERNSSQELSELLAAAKRASTLTRQLLAFGRRQVMQVQRVDLNRVVMQVQAMLTGALGAQIRLSTTLEPRLPQVEVDPGQLEQVLVNLAINARDAMPDGGTLHIDTSAIDVARPYFQMPSGRYVRLSVSDTGTGMAPDVLAHIFEPFYTTKGTRGTGLGLSSVYGIVKQSGGFIWCSSEPSRGTTFTIYLRPAEGAATAADPEPATQSDQSGSERVLIVDDEPGVRRLMTRLLRVRGYAVHDAEDGPSALQFLEATDRPVDLVVTDVVMPGMSGIRLAEAIESRWPEMKLLFVTGYADRQTLGSIEATSRPVLCKPFTPAVMAATVRAVLESKAPPALS